jgi:hypothetical protein
MARAFLPLLHAAFAVGLAVRDSPMKPVCANGMWCPPQSPSGNMFELAGQTPSRAGGPLPELACAYPYFNPSTTTEVMEACEYDIVRCSSLIVLGGVR